MIWWGNESDGAENGGVPIGHFTRTMNTVLVQLSAQPWANKGSFLVHFHKIHPKSHRLADTVNFELLRLIKNNPKRFSLHDTTRFEYADDIHLNADQKEQAASDVCAGKYLVELPVDEKIQENLLMNGHLEPSVVQSSEVASGDPLIISIPAVGLSGEVITFSTFAPNAPLQVSLFNKKAMILPSTTREFVSFHVSSEYKVSVRIALAPSSKNSVKLQNMKLQIGCGYSPLSEELTLHTT